MRRVLQLFATSALRSRVGVAIVLLVVVFGVVGVARAVSGPDDSGTIVPQPQAQPESTVSRVASDDGVVESAPVASPTITLSPGTPAAEDVAAAFASAWLNQDLSAKRWHAALLPHATPALAKKLEGVDPLVVPAERLTGPAVVVPRGEGFLEITFPVDSGHLRLRLVAPQGRWLVDGVDWERA